MILLLIFVARTLAMWALIACFLRSEDWPDFLRSPDGVLSLPLKWVILPA